MSTDEKQICLFCKWWKVEDFLLDQGEEANDTHQGQCRLSAPVLTQWTSSLHSGGIEARTMWPKTYGGDFCGKFQERRDDHGEKDTGDWKSIGDIAGEFLKKRTEGTQ